MSSETNTARAEIETGIGGRLRRLRGPRTLEAQSEKMGISRQRLSQMEKGDVPDQWLQLVRLAEADGIDIGWLLTGAGGNGR